MKYERLFESFGPSVWGKIVAGTIIGALCALGTARKVEGSASLGWGWIAAAGAVVGLVAGLLLGLAEIRGKRIAAGTSKPLSAKGQVLVFSSVIAAVFLICLAIVFGPSLSMPTSRLKWEPEVAIADPPESLPSDLPGTSTPNPSTQHEPSAPPAALPPAEPATPAAVIEPVKKPTPTPQPATAITRPPTPPATVPPGEDSTKPAVQGALAASPPAKPAVPATVQTVSGRWKLNKTLTARLLPDGTLTTNYPAIRGGKWTLTNGETVTIFTAKGVAVYTFKLNATGTAGTGNWKDGSKANPTRMD